MKNVLRCILPLLLLGACDFATVESTEHCFETRYGKVVNEKMSTGLAYLGVNDATCFKLTEQNWPTSTSKDEEAKEIISGQNFDKLTITADVAMLWSYDPATIGEVFREKRSPEAVEIELKNAVREGFRNAIASWTTDDLIGPKRATLGDSVRAHIQHKIGNRARIQTIFIRGIGLPGKIEQQQLDKMEAVRRQETERANFTADSLKAFNRQYQAQVEANIKEMNAKIYDKNPSLLQLEVAKVQATGLAGIFKSCTTNCVLGGTVADAFSGTFGVRNR